MGVDELNARFSAIQASIKAEGLITRRHIDIVAEGLRGDIRLIAEAHEVLRQKMDGLSHAVGRLEAGQDWLETSNEREQRR